MHCKPKKLDLNIPGVNIGLSSGTQLNPAKPLKVRTQMSMLKMLIYRFCGMKKYEKQNS